MSVIDADYYPAHPDRNLSERSDYDAGNHLTNMPTSHHLECRCDE